MNKIMIKSILAGVLLLSASFAFAATPAPEEDPSFRSWTNAKTGTSVEARAVALNAKTVKLMTTAKKSITMPLEKLSEEDRAWLEENKNWIGKPISAWPSTPSGPLATEMKGLTYMLDGDKFKKKDPKLNAQYFILYFSASWCGPCRNNAPHSVEAYNKVVKDNPNVEVVMCSVDRTLEAAEKWAAAEKMPWPVILHQDWMGIVKKMSPGGVPTMILMDKEGNKLKSSQNMEELVKSAGGGKAKD